MPESELLEEKYRVQKKLAEECSTVREYLRRSHIAAGEIAKSYGFSIRYIELPGKRVPWPGPALEPIPNIKRIELRQ